MGLGSTSFWCLRAVLKMRMLPEVGLLACTKGFEGLDILLMVYMVDGIQYMVYSEFLHPYCG